MYLVDMRTCTHTDSSPPNSLHLLNKPHCSSMGWLRMGCTVDKNVRWLVLSGRVRCELQYYLGQKTNIFQQRFFYLYERVCPLPSSSVNPYKCLSCRPVHHVFLAICPLVSRYQVLLLLNTFFNREAIINSMDQFFSVIVIKGHVEKKLLDEHN